MIIYERWVQKSTMKQPLPPLPSPTHPPKKKRKKKKEIGEKPSLASKVKVI